MAAAPPASVVEILSSTLVTAKGGILHRCKHASTSTKTDMIFAIFLPSCAKNADSGLIVPALYWLSGLTCTDQNFSQKAGAFGKAEELGLSIVLPDTSPRGNDDNNTIPDDDAYDLGMGAGFYINATQAPWNVNYHMQDYVTKELPALIGQAFPVVSQTFRSITGHSMGGHGALTLALKETNAVWTSVSAFAPICHPTACPWGDKAFKAYLGSVDAGKDHDATLLIQQKANVYDDILIHEGTADGFKDSQLCLTDFEKACASAGQKLTVHRAEGFDHSYYFIAAFINEHLLFHSQKLQAAMKMAS